MIPRIALFILLWAFTARWVEGLTFTKPAAGDIWVSGQNYTVDWMTSSGDPKTISLRLVNLAFETVSSYGGNITTVASSSKKANVNLQDLPMPLVFYYAANWTIQAYSSGKLVAQSTTFKLLSSSIQQALEEVDPLPSPTAFQTFNLGVNPTSTASDNELTSLNSLLPGQTETEIGVAVGSVFGALLVGAIIFWLWRRSQQSMAREKEAASE
jgi:hypothetical protein